jgi:uncharacterized protein YceH (UPF0502 family)
MKRRTERTATWVDVLRVAEYMGLEGSRKRRRQYVIRVVRRMERRDQTQYLRLDGNRMQVHLSALDQLREWDPTSGSQLRQDMDAIEQEITQLKRRLGGQGHRIRNLEESGTPPVVAEQTARSG